MTTERSKWWKAFLPRRKSTKDSSASNSHNQEPDVEPDFDPFKEPSPASSAQQQQQQQESSSSSTISSSDTYDDSKMESMFNENTCRRKLKVSRSGRFKERIRKRVNLPIQDAEAEANGEVP